MPSFDVCVIGNALTDLTAPCDDAFLAENTIPKGHMSLIDDARTSFLYPKLKNPKMSSGGSGANTAHGIASLGGTPAYLGKVGNDELGSHFATDLVKAGVYFNTPPSTTMPTGCCFIFVTPDAQRSMNTNLGAAISFGKEDLDADVIQNSQITYLEGYLLDSPSAEEGFHEAITLAHAAGKKLALSLSDSFCVNRYPEKFHQLMNNGVDILFANEEELRALFKTDTLENALIESRKKCALVVATRGAEGSLIATDGTIVIRKADPIKQLVDTTGAGDLFAAGFLFGLTHGLDLESCANIATQAAAEIITHYGSRPLTPLKNILS